MNPRYEILHEIGRGAVSVVYLAREHKSGREIALKVPQQGTSTPTSTISRLGTPACRGLPAVYEADPVSGAVAMEYLRGGSLRDRLNARTLAPEEALVLAQQLLETLRSIHAHASVHGDIAPRNIMFRPPAGAEPEQAVLVDFSTTAPRDFPGTPAYTAPERLTSAAPASVSSDLFSVGAVLWESLAGYPMRDGADLEAGRLAPKPLPASYPENLVRLVSNLTAGRPHQRLASAAAALCILKTPVAHHR